MSCLRASAPFTALTNPERGFLLISSGTSPSGAPLRYVMSKW